MKPFTILVRHIRMKHHTVRSVIAFGVALPAPAAFATPVEVSDHGWYEAPIETSIQLTTPTQEDIVRLADLDGDSTVITDEERQMMAVLREVLGLPAILK